MLLAYLDESYTKERYYVGALIVPDTSAQPITDALDEIVRNAAAQHPAVSPEAELHAYELVGGKGDWGPIHPKHRVRIAVYQDALQAMADHGAKLIVRGVDIPRLNQRYTAPDHPHNVVLTHLIERVDDYARDKDELALMIADEIDQEDEHRRNLWFLQRNGTWGWRARPINQIVDTLHFAPSKSSRLLQAADLAVYLYRRRRTHKETDARAERAYADLEARLQPMLAHHHCWMP